LRERATIGVLQNRPYFTPEVAKRASSAQTARSQAADELAAGGGGDPVDAGDHGLRQAGQLQHHPRAEREQLGQRLAAAGGSDLLQVVAGAERLLPGPGEDDDADGAVLGQAVQLVLQGREQLLGEAVVGAGPVQGEPGDPAPVLAQEEHAGLVATFLHGRPPRMLRRPEPITVPPRGSARGRPVALIVEF
jgi:hypothetical protein